MLNKENVEKIGHLARLDLTDQEVEEQLHELNMIVEMMDSLNTIDTDDVLPLNHVADIHNVYREDAVHPGLPIEKVLKNAPETTNDMFQVPRIV